ncbi:MAG: glycine cleavage system protein H, partial [Paramuribaculum sp.]|nr:glycine cleavage system protein H [Paramuribaculum sp.]
VIEINENLEDNPRLVNEDCMANWIIKVKISDPAELEELMDEAAYKAFCDSEGAH